jgi:CBS domain containing-hemolysin-like protein
LFWFHRLISPVIMLGDWVAKATLRLFGIEMTGAWLETEADALESRAQLRNRIDSLLRQGDLPAERREEVLGALDVDELAVREIMVPADQIVAISTADDVASNLERIRFQPYTRFPLVGDSLDDVKGIVYAPTIIDHYESLTAGETSFQEIASPPMTIAPTTSVSTAFDQFQAEDQELAVVIDDGTVVGLITATDALEAVMGDLEDPLDRASGKSPE